MRAGLLALARRASGAVRFRRIIWALAVGAAQLVARVLALLALARRTSSALRFRRIFRALAVGAAQLVARARRPSRTREARCAAAERSLATASERAVATVIGGIAESRCTAAACGRAARDATK